ncbi:efflux RND transporter periplasmic adaptor subunit [Xanthocytophaga agilis]|uniref:Efflux RND transporter periplasmic adaptor subunit n=1 Tax=Xanthocytophaga agilis TaxID=3048010 RepID=A0AAE3RD27_9BACT|nr:efflux RND transporter periplasmic adaptor subunit [Xanthocytophaga agilis]MDJ1506104.1 efflux RND transporter periplasmic adaptor subunit [Xanthocytophaga agilis]
MKTRFLYSAIIAVLFLLLSCSRPQEETKPIRKDVVEYVFASGTLEAENEYTLTALTDGYLTEIYVHENDQVTVGQLIAAIRNPQNDINTIYAEKLLILAANNTRSNAPALQQARARLEQARSTVAYDSINQIRHQNLLESNSISLDTYEKAELQLKKSTFELMAASQNYTQLLNEARENVVVNQSQQALYQSLQSQNQVKALAAGRVLQKLKNTGDFVRKGDAIAVIGSIDQLYVQTDVDETSIQKVKVGQKVLIRLNTVSDSVYQGRVSQIMPTYNEEKQSFTIHIKPEGELDFKVVKTQVQVNIQVDTAKNALLIPKKYINYANQVYLKGHKEPLSVKVSYVSNEWVQVLSGLTEESALVLPNYDSQ